MENAYVNINQINLGAQLILLGKCMEISSENMSMDIIAQLVVKGNLWLLV